jgi:hypothetical protein
METVLNDVDGEAVEACWRGHLSVAHRTILNDQLEAVSNIELKDKHGRALNLLQRMQKVHASMARYLQRLVQGVLEMRTAAHTRQVRRGRHVTPVGAAVERTATPRQQDQRRKKKAGTPVQTNTLWNYLTVVQKAAFEATPAVALEAVPDVVMVVESDDDEPDLDDLNTFPPMNVSSANAAPPRTASAVAHSLPLLVRRNPCGVPTNSRGEVVPQSGDWWAETQTRQHPRNTLLLETKRQRNISIARPLQPRKKQQRERPSLSAKPSLETNAGIDNAAGNPHKWARTGDSSARAQMKAWLQPRPTFAILEEVCDHEAESIRPADLDSVGNSATAIPHVIQNATQHLPSTSVLCLSQPVAHSVRLVDAAGGLNNGSYRQEGAAEDHVIDQNVRFGVSPVEGSNSTSAQAMFANKGYLERPCGGHTTVVGTLDEGSDRAQKRVLSKRAKLAHVGCQIDATPSNLDTQAAPSMSTDTLATRQCAKPANNGIGDAFFARNMSTLTKFHQNTHNTSTHQRPAHVQEAEQSQAHVDTIVHETGRPNGGFCDALESETGQNVGQNAHFGEVPFHLRLSRPQKVTATKASPIERPLGASEEQARTRAGDSDLGQNGRLQNGDNLAQFTSKLAIYPPLPAFPASPTWTSDVPAPVQCANSVANSIGSGISACNMSNMSCLQNLAGSDSPLTRPKGLGACASVGQDRGDVWVETGRHDRGVRLQTGSELNKNSGNEEVPPDLSSSPAPADAKESFGDMLEASNEPNIPWRLRDTVTAGGGNGTLEPPAFLAETSDTPVILQAFSGQPDAHTQLGDVGKHILNVKPVIWQRLPQDLCRGVNLDPMAISVLSYSAPPGSDLTMDLTWNHPTISTSEMEGVHSTGRTMNKCIATLNSKGEQVDDFQCLPANSGLCLVSPLIQTTWDAPRTVGGAVTADMKEPLANPFRQLYAPGDSLSNALVDYSDLAVLDDSHGQVVPQDPTTVDLTISNTAAYELALARKPPDKQ